VKPHPEAYLLSLQKLKLPVTAAVAIEDSPSGLAAAQAAGIKCIAVGHRRDYGQWVGDHVYFSGLEPVSGVLQHLGLSAPVK
jgi:beta-phosphoglucomutase-like phosphatase (HAD superfamily)